jgi:hypothetical protein
MLSVVLTLSPCYFNKIFISVTSKLGADVTVPRMDHLHISDLILKLYVFTRFYRSYFPFNAGNKVPFMESSYENNICFSHNIYKILMM